MASTDSKLAGGAVWAGTLQNTTLALGQSAAGSTQATAAPVTVDNVVHATVGAGAGVILPARAQPGDDFFGINAGANALLVYPPVGHAINALSANAAISVPVGKPWHAIYFGKSQWAVNVGA